MFHLCTVEANALTSILGNSGLRSAPAVSPKYEDLQTIVIGMVSDCSNYLMLTNQVVEEFTKHSTIPDGYIFTFRQEWGLTINEEILHRVIATLRADAYPPMADYLDAKVKSDAEQEADYLAKCQAVKVKYPKFSF